MYALSVSILCPITAGLIVAIRDSHLWYGSSNEI